MDKNQKEGEKMKKENTPELITERLILRKFTEEDREALYEILKDEEVNRFLPWFPAASLTAAETFLKEHYLDSYKKESGYQYAICLKGENRPVGYIGVSMEESHDLGYGLRKEYWNQGIITEAGRAVIERVRKDGIPYLTATHDVKNPASGAVMEKLGMSYQYSYEELWQPKNFLVTFRLYQLNLDGETERVYRKYWEQSEVHFVEDREEETRQ